MLKPSRSAAALSLFAFCGLLLALPPAWAEHPRHGPPGPPGAEMRQHDQRGYVLDSRYSHNHYYPPRGYAVPALPRGYTVIRHGGAPYYFHGGVWYRPYGPRFVVVGPPIGLFVSVLPPFYTTVWVRGIPYYYADDVYYVYRPERHGYEVARPPADDEDVSTESGTAANDLFIYPKQGQSEEQQSKDRYECHSWASNQTGFDPTQPSGGVAESQAQGKRADYQRAMTACLEARGYSVK